MSDLDRVHDAVERLEWDERGDDSPTNGWRQFSRRTALTGAGAGLATALLEACGGGGGTSSSSAAASSVFGSQPGYKFTFVNHVTTNSFFVPTQYGAADACKLLGCSYQWTGSKSSNVSEMVNAFNSAITAQADGIAIALVDLQAFNPPTDKALAAGIPVVSYNADAPSNGRLAYIGQDLFKSGQELGRQILSLVPSGDVALFIATPGSLNIQPRIDGAKDAIGSKLNVDTIATAKPIFSESWPA